MSNTLVRWKAKVPGLMITGAVTPVRVRKSGACHVCGRPIPAGTRVFRPLVSRHHTERFCAECIAKEEVR